MYPITRFAEEIKNITVAVVLLLTEAKPIFLSPFQNVNIGNQHPL